MFTILSIIGTRPEAIKMAPVVKELAKHSDRLRSLVCVSGQHRHMLDQVLKLFEINPDFDLNIKEPGPTALSVKRNTLHHSRSRAPTSETRLPPGSGRYHNRPGSVACGLLPRIAVWTRRRRSTYRGPLPTFSNHWITSHWCI